MSVHGFWGFYVGLGRFVPLGDGPSDDNVCEADQADYARDTRGFTVTLFKRVLILTKVHAPEGTFSLVTLDVSRGFHFPEVQR